MSKPSLYFSTLYCRGCHLQNPLKTAQTYSVTLLYKLTIHPVVFYLYQIVTYIWRSHSQAIAKQFHRDVYARTDAASQQVIGSITARSAELELQPGM